MTWIKPSFAWVLYRSGYGTKPAQERVLKIKLAHKDLAYLLSNCKLINTNKEIKETKKSGRTKEGIGRVQWDPERDLFQSVGKYPRRMSRTRAIQIGLPGSLSEYYVNHIISIEEVTDLAHKLKTAHRLINDKDMSAAMENLSHELPNERAYLPSLPDKKLIKLAMLPGAAADGVIRLGRGCVDRS
mmetsp:Transcript_14026/g.15417  ORF Transcript_14026/g.15417 Transcript_14026/m.15417 type:complete len:186 (+) Transcript_14026:250-807(+)